MTAIVMTSMKLSSALSFFHAIYSDLGVAKQQQQQQQQKHNDDDDDHDNNNNNNNNNNNKIIRN
jgi:hypothetical protein